MPIEQTMSGRAAQVRIDREAANFADMIREEHWSLAHAHDVLIEGVRGKMSLVKISALAKAIACFQCSE